MGMFDTVIIKCPYCTIELEWQSKAGPCHLNHYHADNCPESVGRDLDGEVVCCSGCDKKFQFSFEQVVKPVNIVKLIEV